MRPTFSGVIGTVEGILLVRLLGLMFAARPDHPVFQLLFALTAPLVWPWSWLDRLAGQPRFGARLELATLAAMLVIAVGAGVWSSWKHRRSAAKEKRHGR